MTLRDVVPVPVLEIEAEIRKFKEALPVFEKTDIHRALEEYQRVVDEVLGGRPT